MKYIAESTLRKVLVAKYFAQCTSPKVLLTRFEDLPGHNTFPGFELFPVARLSEFPGFVAQKVDFCIFLQNAEFLHFYILQIL